MSVQGRAAPWTGHTGSVCVPWHMFRKLIMTPAVRLSMLHHKYILSNITLPSPISDTVYLLPCLYTILYYPVLDPRPLASMFSEAEGQGPTLYLLR